MKWIMTQGWVFLVVDQETKGERTFAPDPSLLTLMMEIHRDFHSRKEEQAAALD